MKYWTSKWIYILIVKLVKWFMCLRLLPYNNLLCKSYKNNIIKHDRNYRLKFCGHLCLEVYTFKFLCSIRDHKFEDFQFGPFHRFFITCKPFFITKYKPLKNFFWLCNWQQTYWSSFRLHYFFNHTRIHFSLMRKIQNEFIIW